MTDTPTDTVPEAITQAAKLRDPTHPAYQAARIAMAAQMFAIQREEPESGYGRMADDLMCGDLMEVPTWLALDMLSTLEPAAHLRLAAHGAGEEVLKPCPFCGGTNVDLYRPALSRAWHVHCEDCEINGQGGVSREDATLHWNERLASQDAGEGLREGWRLVPVEADDAMATAAAAELQRQTAYLGWEPTAIWAAMLGAAPPSTPTPPSDAGSTTPSGGEGVDSRVITQADRDAASSLCSSVTQLNRQVIAKMIREGRCDYNPYVQAFAAHRLATTPSPDASPDSGEVALARQRLAEWVEWHDCPHASSEDAPPIDEDDVRLLLAASPASLSGGAEDRKAARVAEMIDEGGAWRACSGCQEGEDGYISARDYPYSAVYRCQPGGGCTECGGIGVIWEPPGFWDGYGEAAPSPEAPANRQEAGEVERLREAGMVLASALERIAKGKWLSKPDAVAIADGALAASTLALTSPKDVKGGGQ